MSNRNCRWVRARLSLWVGDRGPDASERNGEGGDLVAEDRCEIERHLAGCTRCRGHQIALQQALGALMAASALPPVDPYVPSLWPILEHRIAEQDAIATSRQSQAIFGLADRLTRTWTVRDRKQPRLGSILVYGSVASLFVTLVTLAIARRQWVDAESMIAGNTSPLAYMDARQTRSTRYHRNPPTLMTTSSFLETTWLRPIRCASPKLPPGLGQVSRHPSRRSKVVSVTTLTAERWSHPTRTESGPIIDPGS